MKSIAIIGSGATTVYLLRHILDRIDILLDEIEHISIFEKYPMTGVGMPYNPETTDRYNLANISSEEIPDLCTSFADWLRHQENDILSGFGVDVSTISESEVYSRLALGAYFRDQFKSLLMQFRESGLSISEYPNVEIADIWSSGNENRLFTKSGVQYTADKVIIATGHVWKDQDNLERKFYASPWPISKILPEEGKCYNFPIGILGASLSAFDVVSSLSHRHGHFLIEGDIMRFEPFPNTEGFKLVLHDAHGWLPHLQYEQDEAMREIYRHVDRQGMLELLDEKGLLGIDSYFDTVCRPALRTALLKDGLKDLAGLMEDPDFGMAEFVDRMSKRHEYTNAFEGMKEEMIGARDSMLNNRPIHWKETIDDLMYCLNYHAELLPAEDILFFRKVIIPFLMNVIAALPLSSGKILLALYDAGKLELKGGLVEFGEASKDEKVTKVTIDRNGTSQSTEYEMFVSCGGQKNIGIEDYPFRSLVDGGQVRPARAVVSDDIAFDSYGDIKPEMVIHAGSNRFLLTGGIDIDSAYRIIGLDGRPNTGIYDISFTHTSGVRPYSYGLQACSATAEIMVACWANNVGDNTGKIEKIREVTKIYSKNPDL